MSLSFVDYSLFDKFPDDKYLYFTATWCGPCQHPDNKKYFDSLAKRPGWTVGEKETDKLRKVDTDKFPKLVEKYGVKAIPAVCRIDKDGNIVGTVEHLAFGKGLEKLIKLR